MYIPFNPPSVYIQDVVNSRHNELSIITLLHAHWRCCLQRASQILKHRDTKLNKSAINDVLHCPLMTEALKAAQALSWIIDW